MAYGKFTLKMVKEELGLRVIENQRLFAEVPGFPASALLQEMLQAFSPLALAVNTEKSRSEWIVAPILADLKRTLDQPISLFSGISWPVAPERGLDGYCDYIISREPEQFYISAPVIVVVEAKKEDIVGGIGQCIATMYAAWLFNEQEGQPAERIYGIITTGNIWKFLQLEAKMVHIDRDEYHLQNLEKLMGILVHLVRTAAPATA